MAKFKVKKTSANRGTSRRVQLADGITISEGQHNDLLEFLKDRIDFGNQGRQAKIDRYSFIDKEISGFMRLDEDDKERMRDNIQGKSPKPTDFNVELVWAQLDDFLTYLMSVLVPDEGVYSTISPPNEQDISNGFTAVLDKHASWFKHYPELAKAIFEMIKYNFGGWAPIEWVIVKGNKLSRAASGELVIKNEVVREGNRITALDPYNFIYDISVDPVKLNSMGEFFAIPELHTPFRIKKMEQDEEIFGTERFMDRDNQLKITGLDGAITYYESKPDLDFINFNRNTEETNWFEILGGVGGKPEVGGKLEMVHYHGHIIPSKFGLSTEKKYEIWRFSMISDKYIVSATRLPNAHGMLPCSIAMPRADGFLTKTKSFSETLMPLGRFASHEFNVRQRSARKALYGVTVYNKREIPLMEHADVLGGKVPWSPSAQGSDVNKAIMQIRDTPDTSDTLNNVNATIEIMQQLLPVDILKQVANLERATQFQAAATVQGANRRPFKYAKIINTQSMVELKRIMAFNVMQFQPSVRVYSDQTGEFEDIDPSTFAESDIESLVSMGLKGIDKLIFVELLRDVVNMMLQSQIAQQNVDVIGIIDYWTNLFGEKVNFNQFKFKSPIDGLPVEQRNAAFQLLQQALQQQQGGGQPQITNGTGGGNPDAAPSGNPGVGL